VNSKADYIILFQLQDLKPSNIAVNEDCELKVGTSLETQLQINLFHGETIDLISHERCFVLPRHDLKLTLSA
jgi:hypothetical protein